MSDAISLFISSECPHCPTMVDICTRLVKNGQLSQLTIINVSREANLAQEAGIRSTPTLKKGEFTLIGVNTLHQVENWLDETNRNPEVAHIS